MRILLTGAAGFIGSRVGAALRAAGHDVVGIDVLLPAAHGSDSVLPEGCRQVDVRDADALAPLLAGVDLVCHHAAMVGAGVDAADAPAYGGHNDFATTVLLAQMFAAGVRRLVLASSMVVYGQGNYACPEHGLVDPLPRAARRPRRGRVRASLSGLRAAGHLAARRRGCPAAAAQPVRGQ